jgi:ABC-type Fe3+-citrate transport system substrate-binding protein
MTKFRTGVAIAALMITAPAMACTDWNAVAAFDVAIVNQARLGIIDERTDPDIKAAVKNNCDFLQKLLDAAKDDKMRDALRAKWSQSRVSILQRQRFL